MLRRSLRLSLLALAVIGFTGLANISPADAQSKPPKRSITNVTGDVYRYQNNFHYGMLVVTKDSVVVTDPINAGVVSWLKVEIAKRFNKPVTHMIYSHSHGDHNSDGQAWGKDIQIIAHQKVAENIKAGKAKTAMPTQTFDDELVFRIGGKTFELKYLGVGHGDDLIAIIVRPENTAFVVDLASKSRLPFRNFPRTDINGLINQIKTVEALDYKILVPGHGGVGTPKDMTEYRVYIEKLRQRVAAGMKAGQSVEQLVASVTMEDYKDWNSYKFFRKANVQGMAAWLKKNGKM